jgi:hypothetical protein
MKTGDEKDDHNAFIGQCGARVPRFLTVANSDEDAMPSLSDDVRARLMSLDLVGFAIRPIDVESDAATAVQKAAASKAGMSKAGISKLGLAKLGLAKLGLAKLGLAKLGMAKFGVAKLGIARRA